MSLDVTKLRDVRPTPPPGKELVEGPWRFIVDEHDVNDPKTGKFSFAVTAEDLEKAAAKGNQRILDTGDFAPLALGHTVDDLPEDKQPDIIGFAGPYVVKDLYNTGRKAIAAKEWYFKDRADEVQAQYPRRSVEVTWAKHLIDPIAVLGATTPARDLGLTGMQYSLSTNDPTAKKVRYDMNQANPILLAEIAEILAAFKQTAEGRFLSQMMRDHEASNIQPAPLAPPIEKETPAHGANPNVAEPPTAEAPCPVTPPEPRLPMSQTPSATPPAPHTKPPHPIPDLKKESLKMADTSNPSAPTTTNVAPAAPMGEDREQHRERARYYHEMAKSAMDAGENEHYAHCSKMAKQCMEKYASTASNDNAPSAPRVENEKIGEHEVHKPAITTEEEKLSSMDPKMTTEKLRMQMSQQAIEIRRLAERDAQREAENRELKLKYQGEKREKDLIELEVNEGVLFDRAEELADVTPMTEEDYQKHLTKMKTRYARAPIGGRRYDTAPNPHNIKERHEKTEVSVQRKREAIALAAKDGIDYPTAINRLNGKV